MKGGNLKTLIVVAILQLSIMFGSFIVVRPYFDLLPCYVCGRADTKPVATLWEFSSRPVPSLVKKRIWYCRKHITDAPEIIKKIPSKKDTIAKRFWIVVSTSSIALFTLFFTIYIVNLSFYGLLIHPAIIITAFLIFGVTGNITLYITLLSIFILPVVFFFIWQRWGYKKLLNVDGISDS